MNNLIPFYTLARKEVKRIFRIWSQTLIPPIISVTIYFIIFHHLFSLNPFHYGPFDYLQFLTPGLIMMPVITSSYNNTAGSFFTLKFQTAIEELLVSPISEHAILWGFLIGSIIRGVLTGVLVLIVSTFFAHLHVHHPLEALSVIIDTSIIFGLGGLINAVYAKKFDDIGIVPNFILTPLTYLGGVFFSINSLPTSWQWIAKFNPIFYVIGSFRHAILGVADAHIGYSVLFEVLLSLALYFYAYYLLKIGKNLRN